MKILPNHLNTLKAHLQPLDTEALRNSYRNKQFPNADLVKDLDRRYRWDLLYFSKLKIGDGVGIKGDLDLYAYMNDTHIDTALKSFIPNL